MVGGGASGVELAGYLSDILFRSMVKDYPQIPPDQMRLIVLELGDRLLPAFDPRLSAYAQTALRSRGVEVRLATAVRRVVATGLTLESGERIPAGTIIWTGGVSAPEWLADAGLPIQHGRVVVQSDLRLADHPETFVIGDAAAVRSPSGGLRPQVAQVAVQGRRHAARQIAHLVSGRATRPFRYLDKGAMAMVGVYDAVVESGPVRLSGPIAWAAWGTAARGLPARHGEPAPRHADLAMVARDPRGERASPDRRAHTDHGERNRTASSALKTAETGSTRHH